MEEFSSLLLNLPPEKVAVGMWYVTDKGMTQDFLKCGLCCLECSSSCMVDHISGFQHQCRFLMKHHWKQYAKINFAQKPAEKEEQVKKLCLQTPPVKFKGKSIDVFTNGTYPVEPEPAADSPLSTAQKRLQQIVKGPAAKKAKVAAASESASKRQSLMTVMTNPSLPVGFQFSDNAPIPPPIEDQQQIPAPSHPGYMAPLGERQPPRVQGLNTPGFVAPMGERPPGVQGLNTPGFMAPMGERPPPGVQGLNTPGFMAPMGERQPELMSAMPGGYASEMMSPLPVRADQAQQQVPAPHQLPASAPPTDPYPSMVPSGYDDSETLKHVWIADIRSRELSSEATKKILKTRLKLLVEYSQTGIPFYLALEHVPSLADSLLALEAETEGQA